MTTTMTKELSMQSEITQQTIDRNMAEIRRNAVSLKPETVELLDSMPILDSDRELIKAWDGVLMPKGCFRTSEAVLILNAAPRLWEHIRRSASPFVAGRSRSTHIPMRMWRDFWEDSGPAESLRMTIQRVMRVRVNDVMETHPSISETASELGERPRLSVVISTMREIGYYPAMVGKERPPTPSPAEVEMELGDAGIEYERDMRPLESPETVAKDPSWKEREWVVCATCRTAVDRSAAMLQQATAAGRLRIWAVNHNLDVPILRAYCPADAPAPWYAWNGSQKPDNAETYTNLDLLEYRSIGQNPDVTPYLEAVLAYRHDMTSEAVGRVITGEEPDAEDRVDEKCPLSSECETFCGEMQRDGYPRPFTRDGAWESCDYGLFLRGDTMGVMKSLRDRPVEDTEEKVDRAVAVFEEVREKGAVQAGLF